MALSEKQKANVTLAEIEEMAARAAKATETIREARALLGLPQAVVPNQSTYKSGESTEVEAHPAARSPSVRLARPLGSHTPQPIEWTPEELAKREALRLERMKAAEAEADEMQAEFAKAQAKG